MNRVKFLVLTITTAMLLISCSGGGTSPPGNAQDLSAPSGLTLSVVDGDVVVQWNAVDGVSSYTVGYGLTRRGDGNGTYDNEVNVSVPEAELRLSDLARDMTYYFAVKAADDDHESEYSVEGEIYLPPTDGDIATMVHSEGTQIVDPEGNPLNLRCVNVEAWLTPPAYLVSDSENVLQISPAEFMGRMDDVVGASRARSFWKDWRDNFITEDDFARMSALGFNCARLIIYYRAIATLESGEPVFDESRLAYIDSAVSWAKSHGMYVVLDLHAAPGGQNPVSTISDVPSTDRVARLWVGPDAAANKNATVSIWGMLAERYRNETTVAGYDLLNEPVLPDGVDDSELVDLYQRIVTEIRRVDSKHMIILEGNNFAHDFSMFSEPMDDNMAYEFHAYALFSPTEKWAIPEQEDLQPYLDLRDLHDRPLWLGEFGENDRDWIIQMVNLMEVNGIGWALYPWKRKMTRLFRPVLQMIPNMERWYAVAQYLAQPADGDISVPTLTEAEEGMADILSAIQLANCTENEGLAAAIINP